jgi:murein DD-endopeptidase MepM/ murein hydrolase activator NlpD
MYIPNENSKVRSFPLSKRTAVGAGIVVVGVLAFVLGLALAAFLGGELPGRANVVAENDRLRTELKDAEGEITTLGQTLETLLEREEELRLAADLPAVPLEVQAVGVGGPGHTPFDGTGLGDAQLHDRVASMTTSLDVLLRRSELVASSFEDVQKSIASNRERFEATPSIWPASGFLSSTYSMRRRHPIFHDVRPHFGIDISANRGNPILATAAGRVVRAGWQNGHGNQVEIEHGHDILTKYSHASKILVKPGQKVKRGDTIGLVGSTGYAVAPHVHYEVHENGIPVDPLKYIFPDAIAD